MISTALAVFTLVAPVARGAAADDATLLRVFLTDGTSLVSYGEPALVGDRVVFSMPLPSTSAGASPPLHLVNLPLARVDWNRTNRYAGSARAEHYLRTQADFDYAALSNTLADALNRVASTNNPAQRLEIVEQARKTLSEWPPNHYNYREAEVRQMLAMLDEAIADLQVANGSGRFNLSLTAFAEPPAPSEPLLPPPSLQESIAQLILAARATDASTERVSLLSAALVAIDHERDALRPDWVSTTRAEVEYAIKIEHDIDKSYALLTQTTMNTATRRARSADVLGLERLVSMVRTRDHDLGGSRPEVVNGLLAAVDAKLDAARRLRLARDKWLLEAPAFAAYGYAITTPMDLFQQMAPALEAIRSLSGSTPATLSAVQRTTARILALTAAISPPEELRAAHALLVSAVQLAANAGKIRREAALANDMERAWNASSAAAGALMLGARAESDIRALLKPPQLQ